MGERFDAQHDERWQLCESNPPIGFRHCQRAAGGGCIAGVADKRICHADNGPRGPRRSLHQYPLSAPENRSALPSANRYWQAPVTGGGFLYSVLTVQCALSPPPYRLHGPTGIWSRHWHDWQSLKLRHFPAPATHCIATTRCCNAAKGKAGRSPSPGRHHDGRRTGGVASSAGKRDQGLLAGISNSIR